MEKNQLIYVIETARCGSITRAAEKLHLSQPSLSNQIIQLERELGVPLFERFHKRIQLTPAGEVFVREAEPIIQNMASLKKHMEEFADQTRGSLRLGALSIMCSLGIPEFIASFRQKHLGLEVYLTESGSASLLQDVQENRLDAAFVILRPDLSLADDFTSLLLGQSETLVALPSTWCIPSMSSVTLEQLAQYPLIATSNLFNMSRLIFAQMDAAGLRYTLSCSCSQIDSCLSLVSKEMGVTFCSRKTAEYYHYPNIRLLPFSPQILRKIYLVYHKDPAYYPVLRLFLQELEPLIAAGTFN